MLRIKPKRGTHQIVGPARLIKRRLAVDEKTDQPTPAALEKRLLTVKEAATYLSVCQSTLRTMVWGGVIPSVRMNRRVLIDVVDLDRLIERSKVRTENAPDSCRPLAGVA